MPSTNANNTVHHRYADADGVKVFYREAGSPDAPVMLLLHGYPTHSGQYRELIPRLAPHFRVIAPDFPGFGFTQVPKERNYKYSFEGLTNTLEAFVDKLGLKAYSMYIFDYGAPTGLRLAVRHPERVKGLVTQNGNAYTEGLGDAWGPMQKLWADPTPANRQDVADKVITFEATKWQYEHGAEPNVDLIAPETYTLDYALLDRPGSKDIQLDLVLDYASNLKEYPSFHEFFRKSKFPTLVIWGKNDAFFIPPGAEAFKRDIPHAVVEFVDTGHFALETHGEYIAKRIIEVLAK